MTRQYSAVHGKYDQRIITVSAPSRQEAERRIEFELMKNPSRRAYLQAWEDSGRKMIDVTKYFQGDDE